MQIYIDTAERYPIARSNFENRTGIKRIQRPVPAARYRVVIAKQKGERNGSDGKDKLNDTGIPTEKR